MYLLERGRLWLEADTQEARVVDVLASVQGVELGESGVQVILSHIVSSRTVWATRNPAPKVKRARKSWACPSMGRVFA